MMVKVIGINLQLDDEVAALVTRVGNLERPKNYITKYTVERETGAPTLVTVTFIADGQFSFGKEED